MIIKIFLKIFGKKILLHYNYISRKKRRKNEIYNEKRLQGEISQKAGRKKTRKDGGI